jgi:23S rRNA A1618 N6-methylase RlmF
LNLVTDKSTNISNNRIINTSVITNNSSSFYISNLKAELRKLGAKEVVDHTITQAKKFTKGDLLKLAL